MELLKHDCKFFDNFSYKEVRSMSPSLDLGKLVMHETSEARWLKNGAISTLLLKHCSWNLESLSKKLNNHEASML